MLNNSNTEGSCVESFECNNVAIYQQNKNSGVCALSCDLATGYIIHYKYKK